MLSLTKADTCYTHGYKEATSHTMSWLSGSLCDLMTKHRAVKRSRDVTSSVRLALYYDASASGSFCA